MRKRVLGKPKFYPQSIEGLTPERRRNVMRHIRDIAEKSKARAMYVVGSRATKDRYRQPDEETWKIGDPGPSDIDILVERQLRRDRKTYFDRRYEGARTVETKLGDSEVINPNTGKPYKKVGINVLDTFKGIPWKKKPIKFLMTRDRK